jgi:hypothetical protein
MNKANPMAKLPGFEAMRAQQEAFFKAMTSGFPGASSGPSKDDKDDKKN